MNNTSIEEIYPLSPMQEGMLFHSLHSVEFGMYVMQDACTMLHLNLPAFKQAWERVVERHAILRTAFAWKNIEKPLQVVGKQVSLPWQEHDWRDLPVSEQEARFASFITEDRINGFKLSKAPLMRLAFFRIGEDIYKFIWSKHHLLLDGWSRYLLLKEVLAYYEAFCDGRDVQFERPRPFRDYIAWLQQQDLAKAEAFWRQTLEGFATPTTIEAAGNSAKASDEGYDHYCEVLRLSVETTAALQTFARKHQLTMNTLVQGAWALLLSHYSGETDVAFGATVSGRPAELLGVETMVGVFINTLPVRAQIRVEQAVGDWLKGLQAYQVEMRQYEYSPLAFVRGWSELQRGQNLFDTIVVFENFPVDHSLRERTITLQVQDSRVLLRHNYPLVLVADPANGLMLQIFYDHRLFDSAIVLKMLDHLKRVLEQMPADAAQRLGDIVLESYDQAMLSQNQADAQFGDELEQFSF